MGEQTPGPQQFLGQSDDRLDSWKEIAAYLNRDVTTAQRWEKQERMPVHRHLHGRMGSVYAFRADLDAWAATRDSSAKQDGRKTGTAPDLPAEPLYPATSVVPNTRRFVLPVAAAGVALALGVIVWLPTTEYFWRSPIADARVQTITEFDGIEQAAAVSPTGSLWRFYQTATGISTCGSTRSVRDSSIT